MAMDVSVNSAPDMGSAVMEGASGAGVSGGSVGGAAAARFSCGGVVPAFSVVYDVPGDRFQVLRPVAYAPGKGGVSVGGRTSYSWGDDVYCNVSKTPSGGYSATLADQADGDAFMSVLVASIPSKPSAAQGVRQYHVGALVVGGLGREYICGDDSNIVFTPVEDETDSDYGKTKVDVYYV